MSIEHLLCGSAFFTLKPQSLRVGSYFCLELIRLFISNSVIELVLGTVPGTGNRKVNETWALITITMRLQHQHSDLHTVGTQ